MVETFNAVLADDLLEALEKIAQFGTPPLDLAPMFDVGTANFIEYFKDEVLDQIIESGGATCRFFEGPAGSGKTHLLQLLECQAQKKSMAIIRIDLSQALSLSDWKQTTQFILDNINVTFPNGTANGLPSIVEHLGREQNNRASELESAILPHPGFKSAMIRGMHPEDFSDEAYLRLAQYLSGQKVGAGIFRTLNIRGVKNPLSGRNAEQVLSTVLAGLYYLGLSGTILLFDENEKVFDGRYANTHRVQLAANLMRRLIDNCFTGGLIGTVVVFAVLPGFMEACSMVYPALGQRVQVARGGKYKPAWRWPVLSIEEVSTVKNPEEFLEKTISRLIEVVQHCQGNILNLDTEMRIEGKRVLQTNAGAGYRRPLVKALAATAVKHI